MTSLLRSLVFATDVLEPLTNVAKEAEHAGFHRVWTTEYPGRDAIARAAHLAQSTRTVGVGSGIAYGFTRPPLAMAALVADTAASSGGRFVLGLGAGTRGMRERWYGVTDFDRPAPRLAEYVDLMRAAWSATDGLSFSGRFYSADIPQYQSTHDPEILAGLRVFGSGLNATMLRYAALSCDGVALHPLAGASHYLRNVVVPATTATEHARMSELACWAIVSIHDDEETARTRARMCLAFYFSTPSYRTVADGAPWEDAVTAIREEFRANGPQWNKLARLVPDEMVDDLTISGTPETARQKLAAAEEHFLANGATEIVFQTVGVGLTASEVLDNCSRIVAELGPR